MKCRLRSFACAIALLGVVGCSAPPPPDEPKPQAPAQAAPQGSTQAPAQVPTQAPATQAAQAAIKNPLIAASMTMVTASEVPANPLTDATLDQSTLAKEIRWGFRLFTNTPVEARGFVRGQVACSNCHLNAGQRDRALPLVAIAGVFPEYNRRAGRLISLNDRIVECFLRSENATGTLPTATSREVLAIAAYLTWLSRGYGIGVNPAWRGQNTIATAALIPIDKLDAAKGATIYQERCVACHAADGQGVLVGDKRPGPLWGPNSWNDGAGASRVYTLAGIIRYTMPYVAPGSLTDEQAQQVATFITSKPRPAFRFKSRDYPVDPLPPDAVYYPARKVKAKAKG
jgi:thiosulfate dehydrogenase